MSRAALAFATGLGKGYIDEGHYQDRQALLDREMALREADAQTRRELADQQLKQYRDADALKKSLAEASKTAEVKQSTTLDTGDGAKVYDMPAGVDSQDVAASDARQFRRNTEETTGQPAPMPAIESRTSVNGKAYDTHAAGLKAAQEYNDPAARIARQVSVLQNAGRLDAAMEWQKRAEAFNTAQQAAASDALATRILKQPSLEAGGQMAMSAINPILQQQGIRIVGGTPVNDGSVSFSLERQGEDGSWSYAGKNFSVKSLDELSDLVRTNTHPTYALDKAKAAAAARSKLAMDAAEAKAKEDAKTPILSEGQVAFTRGANGTLIPAAAVPKKEPPGESSTKIDEASRKHITDALKDSPQHIAPAMAFRASLLANNPRMLPDDANNIGIRLAQNGGQGIVTTLNPSTGMFERHFNDMGEKDKSGKVITPGSGNTYKLGEHDYRPGGIVTEGEARQAVAAMAASLPPDMLKTYQDAKTPEGLKRYNESVDAKVKTIMAGGKKAIAEALASGDEPRARAIEKRAYDDLEKIEADRRRMLLVNQFYAPKASQSQAAAAATAPAAQSTAPSAVQSAAAQSADPGPRPVQSAGEPLPAYRDRLIAWDRQRMAHRDALDAADRAARNAASEQERMRLLQGRPDLQRLQGMR